MLRWRAALVFSELNLLFPVQIALRLYFHGGESAQLLFICGLLRSICSFTALVLWAVSSKTVAAAVLAPVLVLLILEWYFTTELKSQHLALTAWPGTIVYFACTLGPINYLSNIIADRHTTLSARLAIVQTIARSGLIILVIGMYFANEPYHNAWSCYGPNGHAAIKDFTKGPCPLYTRDYMHSWACVNNNNIPCRGLQYQKYKGTHLITHMATIMTAALYGQHVANLVIVYFKLKASEST